MDSTVIIPSCLALLLYLNTLPADFAYDDSRAIVKNPDLQTETPLTSLFYNDFWGTPLIHSGSHKSYRPLCVLTFRLNYALGGLQPWGYHLGNVVLHAAVSGLFAITVKYITRRTVTTYVASLMFASHPIHTEAVAGVVGRADVLACAFFLLAFLCYARYCKLRDKAYTHWRNVKQTPERDKNKLVKIAKSKASHKLLSEETQTLLPWLQSCRWIPLLGSALFTAAGMLSKEQGVTVIAVCAAYDLLVYNKITLRNVFSILKGGPALEGLCSLALMGTALIGFRLYFMGNRPPEFAPADNPASDSESLLTRALTFFYLPAVNFWLLLCPATLSFDWSMDAIPLVESVTDQRNIITIIFYLLLIYVAIYIHRQLDLKRMLQNQQCATRTHNGNGCTASHQPVVTGSNSVMRRRGRHVRRGSGSSTSSEENESGTATFEQKQQWRTLRSLVVGLSLLVFPFVPATNLFFYVGFVIAERVLYMPSMGFCLLVAEGVQMLTSKWASPKDRNQRHLVYLIFSCLILSYSARTVIRNQDWLSEENLYKSGIHVNPAKAWGNLGSILNSQGRSDEAEAAYRSALNHRGNMADVHYNLGILLQEQNRYPEAIESYKLAIQCRPRLTMAYLNLGIVYGLVGEKNEAGKMYKQCAEIDISGLKDPRLHENTKISAMYNLGRLYADLELYEDAVHTYLEAIQRRPSHYQPQSLYNMLGEAYSKLEDLDQAEHWYREALKAKPDHIPAHLTMAKLMQRRNRLEEAEEWFKGALKADNQKGSVYQHYGQFLGEIGRYRESAEYYIKASSWVPDDFELIFNTANALRQAGRNEEAEKYYKTAANIKPHVATAHMNLGAMLHFNGKLKEAEESYLTALTYKPDDEVTKNNLRKLRSLMHQKDSGKR